MLSRFHLVPERNGQTDGRTDRQICYINIARQYADARKKSRYLHFGDRQTVEQMDSIDALSRSRCSERRHNKKLSCRREAARPPRRTYV